MQLGQPLVSQRPGCGRLAAIGPILRERHCAFTTLADVHTPASPAAFEQNPQPSLRKRMEWMGYKNRIRIDVEWSRTMR
jgi:hypothetical protein